MSERRKQGSGEFPMYPFEDEPAERAADPTLVRLTGPLYDSANGANDPPPAAPERAQPAAQGCAKCAEWERIAQQGHPTPCTLGPLCPYCEIERLRARLAQDGAAAGPK